MTLEEFRSEWKKAPYGRAAGQSFDEFLAGEILIRDKLIERLELTIQNINATESNHFTPPTMSDAEDIALNYVGPGKPKPREMHQRLCDCLAFVCMEQKDRKCQWPI